MSASVSISGKDFLDLKEETLEDCAAILVKACTQLKRERQQASLTSFVGLAIAASAIECAPNYDEAELFAVHMQSQLAQLMSLYLEKKRQAKNDA